MPDPLRRRWFFKRNYTRNSLVNAKQKQNARALFRKKFQGCVQAKGAGATGSAARGAAAGGGGGANAGVVADHNSTRRATIGDAKQWTRPSKYGSRLYASKRHVCVQGGARSFALHRAGFADY